MVKYVVLDRRQAVRHWVLVPAFAGSNPAGPARIRRRLRGSLILILILGRQDENRRFDRTTKRTNIGSLLTIF